MAKQPINKEWWKSKTIWACAASFVVAVATAVWGETSPIVAVLIALSSVVGMQGRRTATGPLK